MLVLGIALRLQLGLLVLVTRQDWDLAGLDQSSAIGAGTIVRGPVVVGELDLLLRLKGQLSTKGRRANSSRGLVRCLGHSKSVRTRTGRGLRQER